MSHLTLPNAEALIFREAHLLDAQDFDAWLALYEQDALFWMPAWLDNHSQTKDPDRELSLIYYQGKANLEDRVKRLRSGLSPASKIPMRVVHLISNIRIEEEDAMDPKVHSSFANHVYDPRADRISLFFGHYEHRLRWRDGSWRISQKIIRLATDNIPTLLDVNAI